MSFRIEPFRHKVKIDPNYAERALKILEDAIYKIYSQNARGLSFEELYRNAYNMVLHKYGEKLYSGLVNTLTQHLRRMAGLIESVQGGLFMDELNEKWADHTKALQIIRGILMYMDRTYVANFYKAPVYELGLNLWQDNVVRSAKIKARLRDTLLDLIHKERNGEVINRGLMRNITKMMADLGPSIYQDDFEKPFLDASSEFYCVESRQLIECCDCGDYLRKVEKRLSEEAERVSHYLDQSSEPKIVGVLEKEMIANHRQQLVGMAGLIAMLTYDRYDDLRHIYTLFSRASLGLSILCDTMVSHLHDTYRNLVADPQKQDPIEFIHRLLNTKEKYDSIITVAFSNDKTFQTALNSSFEYFVNLSSRSPEFLWLFVDDKLRKGLKGASKEGMEGALDKAVTLFHYLQEKDVFEKYYKQHLAKRLLSGKNISAAAEWSFLVKLKTECGYQFTSKLEGMFTDMRISRDTMLGFNMLLTGTESTHEDPALSVQVLTMGSWPIQTGATCNLPSEILSACEKFQSYYLSTHTGRKLTWQTNMGTADLKAMFGNGQKHELNVSTYQMCILMQFNTVDCLTYKEIEQVSNIPVSDLKWSLQSMACIKGKNVLRKEPMSKDINETDVFAINEEFTSKLYKVKIGTVAAQKEREPEKQETRRKVEEDQKLQVEAAIVRVMKSRRVLDHNSIVSEVMKQLQPRFLPNPALIKKRIESLIEREFLERDKNDRKLYRYLA